MVFRRLRIVHRVNLLGKARFVFRRALQHEQHVLQRKIVVHAAAIIFGVERRGSRIPFQRDKVLIVNGLPD